MQLRSQGQKLIIGIALCALLCVVLAISALQATSRSHQVSLGKGMASVESMLVTQFDGGTDDRGRVPTPGESGIPGGHASYYGHDFAGDRTASGEAFSPNRLTAAHRTLPLGSRVRVTNPRNGESVIVRINDRGPFHGNRVIDLSLAAAKEIGLIRSGIGRVKLSLIV